MTRVTQHDVAKRVGVSGATVSRALAGSLLIPEATRQRVAEVSRDLGYKPRRTLRPGDRMGMHAAALVLVDRRWKIDSGLPADTVARCASAQRMDVRLRCVTAERDEEMGSALLDVAQGIKGLLLYGQVDLAVMNLLADGGIPFVVIGNPEGGAELLPRAGTIVTSDFVEMGRVATRRLIGLGHTRIGFVCGTREPGMWFDCWIKGWQLAHIDAGLPLDRELLNVSVDDPLPAQKSLSYGEWFARLASPPTAYVVPDASTFVELLKQFRGTGLELKPGAATLGGRLHALESANLGPWPIVEEDIESIVEMAFAQLRRTLDTGPLSSAAVIRIPHRLVNFE